MTQSFSVRCQNCGAPLQIQESLRYITCAHCGSELEIVRDDSTVHTEVIKAIAGELETMRTKVKVLELQAEIDRLDHQWETDRVPLMITTDKSGTKVVPTNERGAAVILGGSFVGLFLFVIGFSSSKTSGFPIAIGTLIIIVGVLSGINIMNKAKAFFAAQDQYEKRRQELTKKLEAARAG